MSKIPVCFIAGFSPLSNAVILSIICVTILVDFIYRRKVPSSNDTFASSSKNCSLMLRMASSHWEQRPSVTSQGYIRFNVPIIFLILAFYSFQTPKFHSTVLWYRSHRIDFRHKLYSSYDIHMRSQLKFRRELLLHDWLIVFNNTFRYFTISRLGSSGRWNLTFNFWSFSFFFAQGSKKYLVQFKPYMCLWNYSSWRIFSSTYCWSED